MAAALCGGAPACAGLPAAETREARSAYADFLIAHVANLNADHAAATERYFEALLSEPNSPELLSGAVSSALSAGDIRRARMGARLAEQRNVDVPEARLVRAADALREGRWQVARAAFDNFNGDGVQEFAARLMAIWSEAGAGRAGGAAATFAAIDVPPSLEGVLAQQRALALDLAGRHDEALSAYAEARREPLYSSSAAVREAALLARLSRGGEAPALFRDSYGAIRDPEISRAAMAAAEGRAPTRTPLTPARAAANGLLGLANFLADEKEYDRALPFLTLALILDPDLDVARLRVADALRELGRPDDARAALAAIPRTSAYANSADAQIVWLLLDTDRSDEAVALARSNANDGARIARRTLGDVYRSLGRWDEADAVYSEMIAALAQQQPSDWPLFFVRANARDRLGRWPEAEADLRRALELAPSQPETLNYLGYSLVDRGENLEEGLALIQTALSLKPQSAAIIDSLGWAYFRMGRYEEALAELERAVELEPAEAALNDHLGDVLWRLGRRTEARFQWRRALSQDVKGEMRAGLERKLAEGLPEETSTANAQR